MNNLNDIIITEITGVATVFSPKGRLKKITNRNSYGISFCNEGQITYTHNNKNYISDNKHIIILPQGQSYTLRGDKTGTFPVINFTCNNTLCDTFLLFPIHSTNLFMADFERIKELILFPENHTKIMSIFYNMIYKISSETSISSTLMPAIRYIEQNYTDASLTNDIIASACNISEIYLRKLFLKHLKTTPKQYITEIRLSKAKQLLCEGIYKINTISEKCGFSSSYNFSRFFKEKTGVTPTEYMKENRIHKI